MKKILGYILFALMMLTLTGCGKSTTDTFPDSVPTPLPEADNQPNI